MQTWNISDSHWCKKDIELQALSPWEIFDCLRVEHYNELSKMQERNFCIRPRVHLVLIMSSWKVFLEHRSRGLQDVQHGHVPSQGRSNSLHSLWPGHAYVHQRSDRLSALSAWEICR